MLCSTCHTVILYSHFSVTPCPLSYPVKRQQLWICHFTLSFMRQCPVMQAQEDGARKAEGSCWRQSGQGGEKEKEEVSLLSFGLSLSTLHFNSVCIDMHTQILVPCMWYSMYCVYSDSTMCLLSKHLQQIRQFAPKTPQFPTYSEC